MKSLLLSVLPFKPKLLGTKLALNIAFCMENSNHALDMVIISLTCHYYGTNKIIREKKTYSSLKLKNFFLNYL